MHSSVTTTIVPQDNEARNTASPTIASPFHTPMNGLFVSLLLYIICSTVHAKGTVSELIGAGIPTTASVNGDGIDGSVQGKLMGCYEDKVSSLPY